MLKLLKYLFYIPLVLSANCYTAQDIIDNDYTTYEGI